MNNWPGCAAVDDDAVNRPGSPYHDRQILASSDERDHYVDHTAGNAAQQVKIGKPATSHVGFQLTPEEPEH